jgi:hypothetical protein
LWLLWDTLPVAPLKIFVVLLHEISHGLMAVATGGSIERIVITADQGGACYCGGGNAFLTLSAGYLGSLGWGALLLVLARRARSWSPWVTGFIGAAIIVLSALYIRGAFGLGFALGAGGVLLKSDVLDRPELPSDARLLSELTGAPTLFWGLLWIAAGLAVSWLLVRWLLREA